MRFGFVVHPLTPLQQRLLGVRWLDPRLTATGRTRSRTAGRIARIACRTATGREVSGVLVAVPGLPDELLTDQDAGVAAVTEAVKLCHEHGAGIVGLGAVAAMIGGQGKAVARAVPCPVSTGNAFTAYAAVESIAHLRRLEGRRAPIGLLGPPGPVANAILEQLVMRGEDVLVVAPKPPKPLIRRVDKLQARYHGTARFIDDVEATLGPGRVLVAASSTGGRMPLSGIPSGSIVVDVAAPQDVRHDVPRRDDVLLLDGEYVRLPRGLIGGTWRRVYGWVTGQSRSIFACFAEPMLMALAEQTDLGCVGRTVPAEKLRALANTAADHGFCVDRLHEYGRPVPTQRLARFTSAGASSAGS